MSCNIRQSLVVGALLVVIGASTSAQSRVEKNVVFGMYSGAALLLDVHYPAKSPINYVSADDPPVLLIHGDADRTVPFHQSEMMEAALKKVNVPVKLIRIEGADHGPDFPGAKNPPDYKAEIVKWLDRYLRNAEPRQSRPGEEAPAHEG